MPRVERILERLRPVGAPGRAVASGVPADRVTELAAELEPVLARLAAVQQRCDQIRSAAAVEADRRSRAAAEQARQVLIEAQRTAEAERAAAAAQVAHALEAEAASLRQVAEQAAAATRALAATRLDGLVARVVADIRTLAEDEPTVPHQAGVG